jgi:hypothetical protein
MKIVLCFVFVLGCSSRSFSSVADADADATPDASALDAGESFGEAGAFIDGGVACTGDLRDVLDKDGNVIASCPPDEGCAGGQCVPACTAAAAGHGSVGCDYVVATPSFFVDSLPPCFAMFVANNWSAPIQIHVDLGGTVYDATQFGRIAQNGTPETTWPALPASGLPPGDVAVLFLSDDPHSYNAGYVQICPVTPAIRQPGGTALAGSGSQSQITGRGQAWHVSSSLPVTAYDVLPYGGARSVLPSAELLFPTTSWGTNYLGIVPTRGKGSPQWGQLVAATDGTQVTVVPNVDLPAGIGVVAAQANTPTIFTLGAGEYIQWQDSNEMSGTVIQSTAPVAFTGGQAYDCYSSSTSTGGGCDSAHQQIPPISALGSEYAVAPYRTRRADGLAESIPYRFVGAASGTTLTFDPPIAGAPATLTTGQVLDFETTVAFVVKSQDANHPFYVGQVMTGANVTSGNASGRVGDEEFVNVLPPVQFLDQYVFFTDPSYATTNLVFVRKATTNGFEDVTLDCTGPLGGWQPIGTTGDYEMTNVDLVLAHARVGSCDNGPHTATSVGPFGVTVWGLDAFASYAYPAGGNVASVNTVVIATN